MAPAEVDKWPDRVRPHLRYQRAFARIDADQLGRSGFLDHRLCLRVEIEDSLKIGKCMPGTLIPVVEESRMFEDQPDCAIIFSWHICMHRTCVASRI
jgi:hypothetical protein